MQELTLTTPSILFSAISLIMLAYTNRFLAYSQLIRNISAEYYENPTTRIRHQIDNLRRRLYMTRWMQFLGIFSLFLCVVCTFFIFIDLNAAALWTFGVALVSLIVSLGISIAEIHISTKALEIHLNNIKPEE